MDPSRLCKIFFTASTAVVLGGTLIPSLRKHVLNYGSRATPGTSPPESIKDAPNKVFESVASIQVPHTWFTHFYIISVVSSIFWACEISTRGPAFAYLASNSQQTASMTVNQVFLAWLFMALQGARRLYESYTLMKPSNSKMWVGIWGLGIAYYIFMGISVWVEGIRESTNTYQVLPQLTFSAALNQKGPLHSLLDFSTPSMKTYVAVPIFLIGSGAQHACHKHLASLKKYTLPHQTLFQSVVCPHYTSECLVYIAIGIVAAPKGHLINGTILAGLLFVASNLAVTADSTRNWYVQKFGADKLAGRWRMVPYLY